MWGKIIFDSQRDTYAVRGMWQGKRLYLSQYPTRSGLMPCETKRMAQRLQEAVSIEIESGTFNPDRYRTNKPLLLRNYAIQWLSMKKNEVSKATHYDYKNSIEAHTLPVLGDKYLPDINHDDLRELLHSINRGPKGKKNVMDALRQLMRDARRSGHIPQIPEWPKFTGKNRIVCPPIKYISLKDQALIVGHIKKEHRPIFLFMMSTGCRPSEARALRKIDIKDSHIYFTSAFGRGEELKSVKQMKITPIPIMPHIQEIIDDARNLTPWVFINPATGKPYSKNINRIWNAACDAAQVKRINLYNATRHSFACNMLNSGVDKGMISRLLRHSDPRMIERYAEYEMDPLRSAMESVRLVDFCQQNASRKTGENEK